MMKFLNCAQEVYSKVLLDITLKMRIDSNAVRNDILKIQDLDSSQVRSDMLIDSLIG